MDARISYAQRRHIFVQHFRRAWLIILFGVALFIVGTLVLFLTEKQTAQKTVSLDEARANVRSVAYDAEPASRQNGEIIYIMTRLVTDEPLTEPDYNIQVQAVKLKRQVQMYQWIEEETEASYGQSLDIIETPQKTYYYMTDWREKLVDSSTFHVRTGHENPREFPIKTNEQTAAHVYIGKFELGTAAKNQIADFIEVTSDTRPDDPAIKLHYGLYYHCNDVFRPEIGDIRLRFLTAGIEGNFYTIVAKLENGLLVPYKSSINTSVLIMMPGRHTLDEAFHAAHYERRLHSWALRFIGWVIIFFATICTSEILTVVLSDIPFFAILLPNPSQPLYGIILLSLSMAMTIISISWMIFRPWLAAGIFCAAISPFLFCARSLVNSYERVNANEAVD